MYTEDPFQLSHPEANDTSGIQPVLCPYLPKSAHTAGMCTGYSQGCQFRYR